MIDGPRGAILIGTGCEMCAVLQAQVLTRPVAIASMKNSGLTFHVVLYKGTRPDPSATA